MSRADQSFSRQKPATCSRASAIGIGCAERVAGPDPDAELELVVELAAGPEGRHRLVGGLRWPLGRRDGVPRRHAPRRRGRDSRPARICSWAAAGCRGGTACRRWSRGGCRRRSRCSRRSRAGRCSVQSAAASCRQGSACLAADAAVCRQQRRTAARRSARRGPAPSANRAFSVGPRAASAARARPRR